MLRPKALSERLTVLRLGSFSSACSRLSSAGGISESRRDVKMSARLATCVQGESVLRLYALFTVS